MLFKKLDKLRLTYHIPEEAGDPVYGRIYTFNKLEMFWARYPFLDQGHHEAW